MTVSHLDEPPIDSPAEWTAAYQPDADWPCGRCGETVPAWWRHYMRPCGCTWHPLGRKPHAPDPACDVCGGCGFLPCQPQDMSVLRVSGQCSTCGQPSFYLVAREHGWSEVPDSRRHYDAQLDDDHAATCEPTPLVDAITGMLERGEA